MISLLFLSFMGSAYCDNVISFKPIIVEELETQSNQKEFKIIPYAGSGERFVPKIQNKFGINLSDLEGESDISLSRRNEEIILASQYKKIKNATLFILSLGKQQKTRLKHKSSIIFEAGAGRNYQQYLFRDNNNTPYTPDDDFDNSYNIKREYFFLSFEKGPLLFDYDDLTENNIAATLITGRSYKKRFEGNLHYKSKHLKATLFYSKQIHSFTALDPNLFDSNTDSQRLLLHSRLLMPFNLITTFEFSHEDWQRTQLTQTQFIRNSAQTKIFHRWSSNPWIETKTIAHVTILKDLNKNESLLNFKQEVSSSTQYQIGVSASSHRYQNAPKPSQLFGDGGILAGNNNLPIEKGWRNQGGLWLKNKFIESKLQFFTEESTNSPLQVGISPTKAKTLPIGGIWTRGFFFNSKIQWKQSRLKIRYEYQMALNNSDIDWQRGNPIPDRPRQRLTTGIEIKKKSLSFGAEIVIEQGLYRDLAGLDQSPTQYFTSSHISYRSKKSIVSLTLSNVLLSKSLRNVRSFQDSAGTNILEPILKQPEIKVTMEYLL